MSDFSKLQVGSFLDQLADRTPTPGGGGVAALAGALSVAMARMAAAYSVGKHTSEEDASVVRPLQARLSRADHALREMVSADAAAYENMTSVAKDPGKSSPAYERAVIEAIMVPLGIAGMASESLSVMERLTGPCSQYLLSDLGVAAVLAEATARAAAYSVRVNLPEVSDAETREKLHGALTKILAHAASYCSQVEDGVRRRSGEA
ncbi:MAG: cyclodeaminase/cyclohydrolase family protein [Planctomycetota bacterium]